MLLHAGSGDLEDKQEEVLEKKLKLSRQTLRELDERDLKVVAGGELTPDVRTLPLNDCIALAGGTSSCPQP